MTKLMYRDALVSDKTSDVLKQIIKQKKGYTDFNMQSGITLFKSELRSKNNVYLLPEVDELYNMDLPNPLVHDLKRSDWQYYIKVIDKIFQYVLGDYFMLKLFASKEALLKYNSDLKPEQVNEYAWNDYMLPAGDLISKKLSLKSILQSKVHYLDEYKTPTNTTGGILVAVPKDSQIVEEKVRAMEEELADIKQHRETKKDERYRKVGNNEPLNDNYDDDYDYD